MNAENQTARFSILQLFAMTAMVAAEIVIFQYFGSWAIVAAPLMISGYLWLFCSRLSCQTEISMGLLFLGALLLHYWLLSSIDLSGLAQD